METKVCKKCGNELPLDKFQPYEWNGKLYKKNGEMRRKHTCRDCLNAYKIERYKENPGKAKNDAITWKKNNRDKVNAKQRERIKMDPLFKARETLRSQIKMAFKRRGASKKGNSFIKFVNYTMQDFINHIEQQFELWMTWENQGKYNPKTWDDNDQKTWTWQLDHIKPQSDFKFNSMEDEDFKKCWSPDNLRPYSAKKNVSDGPARVRHGEKK